MIEDLEQRYGLLNKKLAYLHKEKILEPRADAKFQLEYQIRELTKQLDTVEADLRAVGYDQLFELPPV